MPNICHSLCSLSALQFVMVPICNKLHLDQLLWNDAQKFLTCKCKTKSWSKPILLPWGLSIVYCPFNTKANTADLQDCVPHTSVLSTKPVGIMEVPSIVQEHRRSRRWILDWLVVDMYTDHIESHMCSSSLLVLPFRTRTGNGAQICRSHQKHKHGTGPGFVHSWDHCPHKTATPAKAAHLPKLSSGEGELQVLCLVGHHTIVIVKYDMEIQYVYKIRIHEERELDFVR